MTMSLKRAMFFVAVAILGIACALLPRSGAIGVDQPPAGTASPGPTDPTAIPTPMSLTETPGLLLRGSVHLADGVPLQGVIICQSFASYPGRRVASTDGGGDFAAEFVSIPGDEMVTIWPYLEGYSFAPAQVYWRHYHGLEERTLEFTASLQQPNGNPSAGCQ